jgi:hypothetical protein
MTVVQIPSVLYSLIILGLYYIHLKRTDKHDFWERILEDLFGQDPKDEQTQIQAELFIGVPPLPDQLLFNTMLYPAASNQKTKQSAVLKNMSYQMRVLPQDFNGKLKTQNSMPVTLEFLGARGLRTNNEPVPVTDEISILVCMIVLLGGLADLGMLNGFILEFEAQLIIISIVLFCVLEISRMQFNSYFVYCLDFWVKDNYSNLNNNMRRPFDDIIFNISVFVDMAVLIFQVFFLIIWQSTRNKIIIQRDDNFNTSFNNCLLAEVIVYMLIKFCLWGWKVICFVYNLEDAQAKFTNTPHRSGESCACTSAFLKSFFDNYILSKLEYFLYFVSIIVFFGVILNMLMIPDSEHSLIQNEQRMYQSSNRALFTDKDKCYTSLPETAFKESFMYKDMMCKKDKEEWGGPVAMKVFAWTRFLVLQDLVLTCKMNVGLCPPASALFCANGFEHEWGKCKQLRNQPTWDGLKIPKP